MSAPLARLLAPQTRPVDLPVPTGNPHHNPRPPGTPPQPNMTWTQHPLRPGFYRWVAGPVRPEPPGNRINAPTPRYGMQR